ncbi:MAG: 23S rRNA (guanosine(2251)-2'-O)-methyltransferase RlmB [Candidatus Adiutrix sp.]
MAKRIKPLKEATMASLRSTFAKNNPSPAFDDEPQSAVEQMDMADKIGGLNPTLAALKARPKSCRSVLVAEGRHPNKVLNEIISLAKTHHLQIKFSPRKALDRAYGQPHHQGVVAIFEAQEPLTFDEFLKTIPTDSPALILALDKVEDPGNLGALMRSALAFGACGLIAPRDRSASLTPGAAKAAAGAAEFLPLVRVVNLARTLEELKAQNFWVVGAAGEKNPPLSEEMLPQRMVLVLGSEGRGLGQITQKVCDMFVNIPQNTKHVQSLNVSVAGAIIMAAHFKRFQNFDFVL